MTQCSPDCEGRRAVARMVAALGGWEKAARLMTRVGHMTSGGRIVGYILFCSLCKGRANETASSMEAFETMNTQIDHDPECFISIARLVLDP